MLLPVLFYVWILGLGLGAHCKPAHRILSLLTFVLALGLALTLGPSTITALPTVSRTASHFGFAKPLR